MKKILVLVVLSLLFFSLAVGAQTIEDNYAAGGVQLTGGGNLRIDDGYTSFYIGPGLRWFLIDNLSLRTGTSFSYSKQEDESSYNLGLNFSPSYALLLNRQPDSGAVIEFDLYNGINIIPDFSYWITPRITARYYLTPVIASYINFSPVHVGFTDGFDTNFRINVGFGMTYHIPVASKTLF